MQRTLHQQYRPITSTPFERNHTYAEFPPCDALKPYIRCFWGTASPSAPEAFRLVTPDTCMDIIFTIPAAEGSARAVFCGINHRSFITGAPAGSAEAFTFAIRFYPWSAVLFADDVMTGTRNACLSAERYFSPFHAGLKEKLLYTHTLEERIQIAQRFLLARLNLSRQNPGVMNALAAIFLHKGNIAVSELSHYTAVSPRQLERLFLQNMGTGPKQLINLIRYQYLWQDVLQPGFCVQDAVIQYGFSDQAHLLHEFKKYHTMTPTQARELAQRKR